MRTRTKHLCMAALLNKRDNYSFLAGRLEDLQIPMLDSFPNIRNELNENK